MATKKKETKKADKAVDEAKLEKRKERMERLKNRPAEQRPNSKQIDIIDLGNGQVVKNYGYAVKNKSGYQGVVVTSVVMDGDKAISTSVTFVPGNLTVKSKKNHGIITSPKPKKASAEVEVEESTEEED